MSLHVVCNIYRMTREAYLTHVMDLFNTISMTAARFLSYVLLFVIAGVDNRYRSFFFFFRTIIKGTQLSVREFFSML